MAIFDEAGPNHPIYQSGSFIQTGGTSPTPPPASVANVVAEADPLAGSQNKDEWPLFVAANGGEADAAWTLLPATIAAFASTLEPSPEVDKVVWLQPGWQVNLGDIQGVSEVLVCVRDGFSGEVGATLYAMPLDNTYRVFYEEVQDSVADFGGPPVVRGFVRLSDGSTPSAFDREAVTRSWESGYLGDVGVALDTNFEGVEHDVSGTCAALFEELFE